MKDFAVLGRLAPVFLALTLMMAGRPALAERLSLVYEFHSGGFSVGSITVDLTIADGRYRMATMLQTTGIIGFLTGFVSAAETEGRIGGGAALPSIHRVDNLWRGDKRWARALYGSKVPTFEVAPPAAADNRPEVPAEQTADTIDPLSAALTLAMAGADAQAGRLIPVYDGRRRYDLMVQALAPDQLHEQTYQGPAVRLDVRWTRNGGFAKPSLFMPSTLPDSGTIWVAPPRPESLALPLPVRIESDSPFGVTVIRLVNFRPGG